MAIVEVNDLTEYMSGVTLTTMQESSAQLVLDATQQSLEMWLGKTLEKTHVREKVRTDFAGEAMTSYAPILKVLSVKPIYSDAIIPTVTNLEALIEDSSIKREVVDVQPLNKNIVPGGYYIGRANEWFIIEYVTDAVGKMWIDAIKLGILRVASREMTYNHDDTLSIKDEYGRETNKGEQLFKGWQPQELENFKRLKRRMVVRG